MYFWNTQWEQKHSSVHSSMHSSCLLTAKLREQTKAWWLTPIDGAFRVSAAGTEAVPEFGAQLAKAREVLLAAEGSRDSLITPGMKIPGAPGHHASGAAVCQHAQCLHLQPLASFRCQGCLQRTADARGAVLEGCLHSASGREAGPRPSVEAVVFARAAAESCGTVGRLLAHHPPSGAPFLPFTLSPRRSALAASMLTMCGPSTLTL